MTMTLEQMAALENTEVTFTYEGNERQVEVETVRVCGNGQTIITGKDVNKNFAYRSFNAQKMSNLTVVGPKGWVRL